MKIVSILNLSNVKVLLYLYYNDDNDARFSELLKYVIPIRSTLSYILIELLEEGLINRTVINSRPIQVKYSLTERGRQVAECFIKLRNILLST